MNKKNNKEYCLYDEYNLKGKHKIKFKFISSNRVREQFIVLDLYSFKGDIFYQGKRYIKPKRKFPTLDLDEEFYGKKFVLEINLIEGNIRIFNGAAKIIGLKTMISYATNDFNMQIEQLSDTKKRYYCDDYEKNFCYNDLIFEIEILD